MVRKIISCTLMSALFIGGMVMLYLGLEVWLDGTGGRVGAFMIFGGALLATAGAVTLAEDFAEQYLQPRSDLPAQQQGEGAQARALSPPDRFAKPPG